MAWLSDGDVSSHFGTTPASDRQTDILRQHSQRYAPHRAVIKKLSCCRETAQRFVSLNILLSHSRSLKVIRNDTVA